jgi:ActR/RegA family two-component response regulator
MSPLAPAVLVLEKTPRWESELKRRIAGPDLLVRPCRSAADVLNLCQQVPGSVVVIDFTAGAADGLRLLERLDRQRRHALRIVVATTAQLDLEWPARELGAAAFVTDTIGGAALARLCLRLLTSGAGGRLTAASTAISPDGRGPG